MPVPPSALIFMLASATSTSTLGAIVFEGDRDWAELLLAQVEQELERSIPIVVTSSSGELSDLLALGQRSNDSDIWIVLPEGRGEVALLRTSDRTVLMRSLDPNTTSYAMAIATSELVRLLESRSGPLEEVGVGLSVRFSGGVDLEAAPKGEGLLLLPAISIALEVRRWITPFEPDVFLGVRLPGSDALGEENDFFTYRRFGVAFGVGTSLVLRGLLLRAEVAFDLSFASIDPKEGVASVRSEDRVVYGLDGQLGLRVPLPLGFDLELSGGVTLVTNPAEFFVGEDEALQEGRARIRAAFALGWSTP